MKKTCRDPSCLQQGKAQPIENFHIDGSRVDGHVNKCKECVRRCDQKRYSKNREKFIAYQKEYQKNNKAKVAERCRRYREKRPDKILFINARIRARRTGVAFSITEKDVVVPTHCPLLGVKLSVKIGRGSGGGPTSPSLDRKDPRRGYVPGNVWVISWKANRLKSNASFEELERMVLRWRRLRRSK